MSKRAGRLGGAISFLGLAALVAAGLALAGQSPPQPLKPSTGKVKLVGQSPPPSTVPVSPHPSIRPLGFRLTAKLAPSGGSSSATGRWSAILIHTIGIVRNGPMPSMPGCTVSPSQGSVGSRHKVTCKGPVPPIVVPGSGQHWILGWTLTYSNLSSAVSGTDIRLNVPGTASALAVTLCTPCAVGKVGRVLPTDDQALALLKGYGSVVVRTANNPGGEISGQIVRLPLIDAP